MTIQNDVRLFGVADEPVQIRPASWLRSLIDFAEKVGHTADPDDDDPEAFAQMLGECERLYKGLLDHALPQVEIGEVLPLSYLSESWSARKRPDGRWEPGEKISGSGISNEDKSKQSGVGETRRQWLEDLGRIRPGEPFFQIDAAFDFVPAKEADQPS